MRARRPDTPTFAWIDCAPQTRVMSEKASAIRRLALAGFISKTGTEAAFVALAFVIYERTGSGIWLASVFLLTFGIPGLLAPVAGVIADRFDRKRVMIVSDLLSALAFVVLIFTQDRFAMLGVAFVAAVVELPFGAGLGAAVPNLTEPDKLARANSTLALGRKAGVVLGPAAGGLLVQALGGPAVFGLNAVSFVASSGLVASVRANFSEDSNSDGSDEHRGVGAGFRFVRRNPQLLALFVAWTIMFFAVDITLIAQVPLSKAVGAGAIGFGLIGAAWGIGQVIGALAGRRVTQRTEARALFLEMSTAAASLGTIAAIPKLVVAILGEGITGYFDAVGTVAGNSIIQHTTPDAVRGRVFASYFAGGLMANAVAFIVGGFIVEALGPRGVYAVGAVASLVATVIIVAAFRRHWAMLPFDRRP